MKGIYIPENRQEFLFYHRGLSHQPKPLPIFHSYISLLGKCLVYIPKIAIYQTKLTITIPNISIVDQKSILIVPKKEKKEKT